MISTHDSCNAIRNTESPQLVFVEKEENIEKKASVSMNFASILYPSHLIKTRFRYHAYSVWLFTFSDLKTIVIPKTFFGTLAALAGPVCILSPASPSVSQTLSRIPLVFLWVWINLLPFAIDNQRQPLAILEDGINKPWRPLPSKRCTPKEARNLMFIAYPLALVLSYFTGSVKQCVGLMFLGYWYNDLGGADNGFLVRNLINGCGYICFAWGALNTAAKHSETPILTSQAHEWLLILGTVVFSTVPTQDLYDQAGDSMRGRQTMPLVLGDAPARWVLSVLLAFWSFWCPWYWALGYGWRLPTTITGAVIVYRMLCKRSVSQDKKTFILWNLWVVFLYTFPLVKRLTQ